VAFNSVGNSDGNKLKCAPKISKMPPLFFDPSVIPTVSSVGNCSVGNRASNRRALRDVRFSSVIGASGCVISVGDFRQKLGH
jgi:hypothetical protein